MNSTAELAADIGCRGPGRWDGSDHLVRGHTAGHSTREQWCGHSVVTWEASSLYRV